MQYPRFHLLEYHTYIQDLFNKEKLIETIIKRMFFTFDYKIRTMFIDDFYNV